MKMNRPYALDEFRKGLSVASDSIPDVLEQMKKSGFRETAITLFELGGCVDDSPLAQITVTNQISDSVWDGIVTMQGKKPYPVKILKRTVIAVANKDFSDVDLYEEDEYESTI